MSKIVAATIVLVAVALAGCATQAAGPTPTATSVEVAPEPTATAPATTTPVPSATPTTTPANEACVRATTEIPEGQNPTRFTTSGPASGCYDSIGGFLDDIGLTWEEFAPGTVITFWTLWSVAEGGEVVYPTPTPLPISVTISPSMDDGFDYVCGHPPLSVDFAARVSGGTGELEYAWDFDADGNVDAAVQDPQSFTYGSPGVYNATLTINDSASQGSVAQRRIVVIGEPSYPSWKYGVVAQLFWADPYYTTQADVSRAAALARDAGIEVVRMDLSWWWLEKEPGAALNWGDFDWRMRLIRDHRLDVLPVLAYSPRWATGSTSADSLDWIFIPPRDPSDFAAFAFKAAQHYPEVQAWEIWNEPNWSQFWRPSPDPAQYLPLLKAAYLAIKYADPQDVVVLGGLAGNGVNMGWEPPETRDFLPRLYDLGAKGFFDVVAIHPYTHPSRGVAELQGPVGMTLQAIEQHGDDAPVWLTEIGWSTAPNAWDQPTVSEQDVAEWLREVYADCGGAGLVVWQDFRDLGTDPDNVDHHFGLLSWDWAPKPAYYAYQEFIRQHPSP